MSRSEMPILLKAREKLGPPSSQEESHMMQMLYPKLRTTFLRVYGQGEIATAVFTEMRDMAKRHHHPKPSRLNFCATILLGAEERFTKLTLHSLISRNLAGARCTYDVSCGFVNTLALVLSAEHELAGSKEIISALLQQHRQIDPQGMYSTEADTLAALQREAKQAADLLIKDPTGLQAFEYGIKSLRTEYPWSPFWQSRTYTVAGAELARDSYQVLYGLSG